jgi:polyhydroxybutyrate depolymerase
MPSAWPAVLLTLVLAACSCKRVPLDTCDPRGAAPCATFSEVTVGRDRRVYLVVTPGGEAAKPRALVFVLHGLDATPAEVRELMGRGLERAAGSAAVFVYPDGNGGWPDQQGRDVAFFDAVRAKVSAEVAVDRVFVTGFSFGGEMANTLACARGGVIRAIAPLSAGCRQVRDCVGGPVAAWMANGTQDTIAPADHAEAFGERWRRASGCAATRQATSPASCQAYDGCSPSHPVHVCAFPGGHEVQAWEPAAVWAFFSGLR